MRFVDSKEITDRETDLMMAALDGIIAEMQRLEETPDTLLRPTVT